MYSPDNRVGDNTNDCSFVSLSRSEYYSHMSFDRDLRGVSYRSVSDTVVIARYDDAVMFSRREVRGWESGLI